MLLLRTACRSLERLVQELQQLQQAQAWGSRLSFRQSRRHKHLRHRLFSQRPCGLRSRIQTPSLAPSRAPQRSWRR